MPGSPDIYNYDPVQYASTGPNLYDILQNSQLLGLKQQEAQTQAGQLAVNQGQLSLQQQVEAQKLQRQQALQGALTSWYSAPTADGFSRIMAQFPEAADALSKSFDIQNAEQNRQRFVQSASMLAKAQSDPGGTAAAMQTALDSGMPDEGGLYAAAIPLLKDPDPLKQEQGKALLMLNGYARTGDKAGFLDAAKTYLPGPPAEMYSYHDGFWWYNPPDHSAPRVVEQTPGATQILPSGAEVARPYTPGVPLGGLNGPVPIPGPAASGGTPAAGGNGAQASGPLRVGGWTPVGKENTLQAVTNKLNVMARKSGIGIDQQLAPANIPTMFDALSTTEGGIAAAHNNPGGIKDGPWARSQPGYAGNAGPFAAFSSAEAGRAAGIALMNRMYAAGSHTMRDMVLGRPQVPQGSPADQMRAAAQRAIAAGANADAIRTRLAAKGVSL